MAGSSGVGNPSLLIADQGGAVEAAQPPGTRRRCRDRRRGSQAAAGRPQGCSGRLEGSQPASPAPLGPRPLSGPAQRARRKPQMRASAGAGQVAGGSEWAALSGVGGRGGPGPAPDIQPRSPRPARRGCGKGAWDAPHPGGPGEPGTSVESLPARSSWVKVCPGARDAGSMRWELGRGGAGARRCPSQVPRGLIKAIAGHARGLGSPTRPPPPPPALPAPGPPPARALLAGPATRPARRLPGSRAPSVFLSPGSAPALARGWGGLFPARPRSVLSLRERRL